MNSYDAWIREYVLEHGDSDEDISGGNVKLQGLCHEASLAMSLAFPELNVVYGEAYTNTGIVYHWWCKAPDGTIVDPTKRQFPWGHCDYDETGTLTRTQDNQWSCAQGSETFVVDLRRYVAIEPKYTRWIMRYLIYAKGFVRGKCDAFTRQMVEAFPELTRQPGFVQCSWGQEQHWWCVTLDGIIVDPTVNQFNGGLIHYDPIDVNDPDDVARIPIGSCANCSEDIYPDSECTNTVCSNRCHDAYVAYCSRGF